jgi:hypothetical protein
VDIAATLKADNIKVLAEKQPEGRKVGQSEVYIKAEY